MCEIPTHVPSKSCVGFGSLTRAAYYGNPVWSAAFEDEAYRVLGTTARHVHARHLELDILVRHDTAGGGLCEFRRSYEVDRDFAKRRKTGARNKYIYKQNLNIHIRVWLGLTFVGYTRLAGPDI